MTEIKVFLIKTVRISFFFRCIYYKWLKEKLQELTKISSNSATYGGNVHEKERKLTITAVAIISCFSITQMPSALLFLYERLVSDAKTKIFADISSITNCLVLTGKMLNVVLFCLISATFRYFFNFYIIS